MNPERPSIMPISTDAHPAMSSPEIRIKSSSSSTSTIPGLPSPPLSPQQSNHRGGIGGQAGRSSSFPTLPTTTAQTFMSSQEPFEPERLTEPHTSFADGFRTVEAREQGDDEGIDDNVPMLPSQLRKRHESVKLMARTQSQQGQQQSDPSDPSCTPSLGSSENGSFIKDAAVSTIQLDNSDDKNSVDDDDVASIAASYHSGAMVRAKSFSMFESSSGPRNSKNFSSSIQRPSQRMQPTQGLLPSSFTPSSSSAMGRPEMPTRDWVKMQSKMQALESEVSHVKRTNMLLNQELDKVNTHLSRLTSEDENGSGDGGEAWRREYEFLVQQVEWMHRQLQLAHAENARIQAHAQGTMDVANQELGAPQYQTEMTRELCAEVKDLTASLRMWQSAFQQAEEMYRRKCDGERTLKQTLREREGQLSSLVDRLSGYESEFRKSISNYEELMGLSAEMELLERTNNSSNTDTNTSTTTTTTTDTRNDQKTHSSSEDSPASSSLNNGVIVEKSGGMPGTFPGLQQQWRRGSVDGETDATTPPATLTVDQLSVSILSWAALLATYMLS